MVRTRLSVSVMALVIAAGCGESDAPVHRTDLTDEPPGANCPAGGVRLDTGFDDDDSGALEAGEIEQTKYVCAGEAASTLTSVTPEPAGAHCTAGGVKIEAGIDADHDGTLAAAEVASTSYVCGAGEAQIVKAFNNSETVVDSTTEVTLVQASITTTSAGDLLAIGSADVFCTAAQCPAGNPAASGYLWISDAARGNAPIAEYDYWFMQPGATESLTRTAHFPISDAGTHAFNLRGQKAPGGSFSFYRSGITLVFLP